jgi:hypothetical protein
MKEIKYKDFRIGHDLYTVKLIYLPQGGISYNPVVKVRIMKLHTKPRKFLEKLLEVPKFSISTFIWDPFVTKASLEVYCINKCYTITKQNEKVNKAKNEWDQI